MRFLFLFLASAACASFYINPFTLRLQVSKGEQTGWVEVIQNSKERPVAIEMGVYERILDLDGDMKDTLVPVKDFVVYPSEILLYPGEKAKVQVVFNSKAKLESDRAYTLLAKEIYIPLPESQESKNKAMVGFSTMVMYHGVIALETGKTGSLSFVSSKGLDSGRVEVVVENKSAGRVPADNLYMLVGGKKIKDFTGKENSIMPGQKRRFIFKHPKPPTAGEVRFGTDNLGQ